MLETNQSLHAMSIANKNNDPTDTVHLILYFYSLK